MVTLTHLHRVGSYIIRLLKASKQGPKAREEKLEAEPALQQTVGPSERAEQVAGEQWHFVPEPGGSGFPMVLACQAVQRPNEPLDHICLTPTSQGLPSQGPEEFPQLGLRDLGKP